MSEDVASLVVSADELTDALKKFKSIVPKPISYGPAILRDNILLGFTQDYKLCLWADNCESGLRVVVDVAESHGLANLVVSYSGLMAAVSAFKHEDLLLYMSDTLSIRGQSGGGMVECLSTRRVDEYPQMMETAAVEPLVFPADVFMDALAKVAPCIKTGGSKSAVQYVCFARRKQNGVEMTGTDRHRMAIHSFPGVTGHIPEMSKPPEKPSPEDAAKAQHMTGIHNKAVSWMLRHAGRSGDIAIRFDRRHAEITGNGWTLFSCLYDYSFPPYQDLVDSIPEMPGSLIVKRAELLDTLRKAGTAAGDKFFAVTLAGSNNGEALDVYCKTDERVIYTATIPAASRRFPGFTAQCNFLIDVLAAFPDELFEFRFPARKESDFILVRSGGLTYLLSPMKGMDTAKPDYLASLTEPEQEYPGAVEHAIQANLPKRPPAFKAVVRHALTDADYRRSLLKALGVLHTVA